MFPKEMFLYIFCHNEIYICLSEYSMTKKLAVCQQKGPLET